MDLSRRVGRSGGRRHRRRLSRLRPRPRVRSEDHDYVQGRQRPEDRPDADQVSRRAAGRGDGARIGREPPARAGEGAAFWIVRPEVGIGNITGLGTVITGPHIEVLPGAGKPKSEFVGLETPPVAQERRGLKIVLLADQMGSLKFGSPVTYRGIEVGAVQESHLGADATTVNIRVFIKQRYATLVRKGTKFWDVSGIDMKVGLFRGLEVNVESMRTLMAGGIAFATPDDPKEGPAKDGKKYTLHDIPRKDWLQWAPKIPMPPERP